MAEIKKNFTKGRMNLDLDDRLLPQGEYREALNIQISGSENSDVGSVKNILGNTLSIGTNSFLSGWNSDAICVGSIADEKNDRIYWLVTTYDNTILVNKYSAIIRYNKNTNSSELVFVDKENEVLKFDTSNYITGINIVDDFLFFTDGVNEPKKINIPVCISGTVNLGVTTTISGVTATEEHVTVIKKKPTRAPEMFLVRQDAPSDFGFFQNFTFLGVSVDDSITLTITTGTERDISVNDILLLSDPNEQGSLPSNAQVRLKVTSTSFTSPTQTVVADVLFIDSSTTSDTIQFDYLVEDLEDVIFEKVFPRFAYRYKYRDGEYSAFSPFTDVAFGARDFNIHPTKEPYNKGMETNVKAIRLSQFVPYDIPEDVVSIDLLYKSDNDPTIYSIETIKPTLSDGTDNPAWHNVSATSTTIDVNADSIDPSHTGYYEINSDNIHVVIPENQLLRLYDNVPKKALAQDFTANRLIYGNYTQNLDLGLFDNNIDLDYEVRQDFASQSVTFNTGKKSIKSLRTYKAGIVFGDKYGRETSVFTGSKTSSLKIPFDQHENSNRLVFKNLTNVIGQENSLANNTLDPYYFKAYIKETSAEYYNLVVDRVYKTKEDDNLWVSFPSSDRNKVKEDDYIILKKSLDSDDAITSDNKFKIIDIQSNAPDFIKIKYQELATVDSPSDITLLFFDSSFQPAPAFDKLKISKEVTDVDGLPNIADLAGSGKRISLKFQLADGPNNTLHSDRYNALSVSFVDSSPEHYVITLDKPIENQDSWVEVSEGVLEPNLKITFFVDEQKDWEEFQGRFFVKIVANDVSDEFLESQIGTVTQQAVVARTKTFFLGDSTLFDPFHDLSSTGVGHRTNTVNFNTTFGQSDTDVKWENNLDFGENSPQPSWFIDNTFAVAAQPTIVTDTTNTDYFDPYNGNVPDNDVSVSGSLFASKHPDYSSGDDPAFLNNGAGQANQFDAHLGGFVDGLEGIVDTSSNGDFCPDVGTDVALSPRALLTQVDGEYDKAYGPPGHTGIFMHLSFSPVGVDLHDGVNLLKSGNKNTRSGLVLNLQGINNFNQQSSGDNLGLAWGVSTLSGSGSQGFDIQRGSYYDDNGDPFTGHSLLYEADMNRYGVCDAPQDSSLMVDETKNQWNPVFNHPENQAIVDNLKIGSKFKFVNDTNDTIFTIKRVTVKRFYNHTAWNYRNIWNGTNLYNSQADGERYGDTTTVQYAWARWVKEPRGGNTDTERFEQLEDAVKRFGAANNRRVTYILELDKDPRSECSINPETLALDTNTHIHFLKPYVSENSTVLSDNPAVFETEPRENTELDVYYEASNAIPLKLDDEGSTLDVDNDKGYILAPIGSKVYANFPAVQWDNASAQSTPLVKAWDGDVLELYLGLKLDTNAASTPAAQSVSWADKTIRIYRSDNDYVDMEVASTDGVVEITTTFTNLITKLKLKPSVKKVGLNYFNCYSFGNGVESNRIRDDFNQPFISNGVKASTTLEEGYEVDNRTNGLIYSGLYNKNAKVNNLNQFIAAEKITKDLLPTYGSIQKLYARNSDLVALCEDKVVQILADKDALFNADGNIQLVSTNKVLGQSRPFVGDYGISKNPESFAAEGYRAYFTDKQRGAVLRLSMDGLTAISEAGMKDYFGDKLKGSYNNILGSYDKDKDHYNVTFNYNNEDYDSEKTMYDITNSVTVSYKESIKGWSSFKSFVPESGISLASDYYTFKTGRLYRHDNETRNTFYGISSQNSFINVLINDSPLVIKDFKTLNYDGDDGWFCSEITTDAGVKAEANNFVNRENKYFSTIKGLKQEDIKTNELNFQGIGFSTQIRKIQ